MKTIRTVLIGLLCASLLACAGTPSRACVEPEIVAQTASVALEWEAEAGRWEALARSERRKRKACEGSCQDRIDREWWDGLYWGVAIGSGSVVAAGLLSVILIPRFSN